MCNLPTLKLFMKEKKENICKTETHSKLDHLAPS